MNYSERLLEKDGRSKKRKLISGEHETPNNQSSSLHDSNSPNYDEFSIDNTNLSHVVEDEDEQSLCLSVNELSCRPKNSTNFPGQSNACNSQARVTGDEHNRLHSNLPVTSTNKNTILGKNMSEANAAAVNSCLQKLSGFMRSFLVDVEKQLSASFNEVTESVIGKNSSDNDDRMDRVHASGESSSPRMTADRLNCPQSADKVRRANSKNTIEVETRVFQLPESDPLVVALSQPASRNSRRAKALAWRYGCYVGLDPSPAVRGLSQAQMVNFMQVNLIAPNYYGIANTIKDLQQCFPYSRMMYT